MNAVARYRLRLLPSRLLMIALVIPGAILHLLAFFTGSRLLWRANDWTVNTLKVLWWIGLVEVMTQPLRSWSTGPEHDSGTWTGRPHTIVGIRIGARLWWWGQ